MRSFDLVEVHPHRIDDDRAGALHVVDCRHEHLHDLRVGRVTFVGLPQDAEAATLQAVFSQRGEIVRDLRRMAAWTEGASDRCIADRDRIVGIGSGDHLEHCHRILERSSHWTGDVGEQVERDDPGAAGEAHG